MEDSPLGSPLREVREVSPSKRRHTAATRSEDQNNDTKIEAAQSVAVPAPVTPPEVPPGIDPTMWNGLLAMSTHIQMQLGQALGVQIDNSVAVAVSNVMGEHSLRLEGVAGQLEDVASRMQTFEEKHVAEQEKNDGFLKRLVALEEAKQKKEEDEAQQPPHHLRPDPWHKPAPSAAPSWASVSTSSSVRPSPPRTVQEPERALVIQVGGWEFDTLSENVHKDLDTIVAMVDEASRSLVRRVAAQGTPKTSGGLIFLKPHATTNDLWNFKESYEENKADFKLLNGNDAFMGPQKPRAQVRIDIAIGNYLKALCKQRHVEFARGEKQKLKALEIGIERDYDNHVLRVDDRRCVWWDPHKDEVVWDTQLLQAAAIDIAKMKADALLFKKPSTRRPFRS